MRIIILLSILFAAAGKPGHFISSCLFITSGSNCFWNEVDSTLHYQIIPAAGNTFGYDIFSGSHRIIHQPTIPGRPGNNGFSRKKDARKVASLVIRKLNGRGSLPTVSPYELDSLRIKL